MLRNKTVMTICSIGMIPLVAMIIITLCGAEFEAYAAPVAQIEDFTEETAKEPEIGQIRDSAMPCDDPEAFAEWYEEYQRRSNTSNVLESLEEEPDIPIYRIAGELIDPDIQRTIYKALEAENLTDWYTGALAQCFQESHGDRFAINPHNGLDMGLFQYRVTFWNWDLGDIFDAETQCKLYAKQMAERFGNGLTVDQAISRHKTSDYCTQVDWEYVSHVKQWLGQMTEEKDLGGQK